MLAHTAPSAPSLAASLGALFKLPVAPSFSLRPEVPEPISQVRSNPGTSTNSKHVQLMLIVEVQRSGLWQVWGPQLIAATGCEASLLQPAWSYMRVRAWAMPSVLVLMVAQV